MSELIDELFDNISRNLATPTRRQTLHLLGGTLVAGALGLLHKRVIAQTPLPIQTYYCPRNPGYVCAVGTVCCYNRFLNVRCCPPLVRCCEDGQCIVCRRLCPEERVILTRVSDTYSYTGLIIGILGAACIFSAPIIAPGCGAVAAAVGGAAGLGAYRASQLARDIPDTLCPERTSVIDSKVGLVGYYASQLTQDLADPNFTAIAQAVTPSSAQQPFTTVNGLTQQLADASNALLENFEQLSGFADAIYITFNRADEAHNAENESWEIQQLQVAQKYTSQLGKLIDAQPQLFADFANAYGAAGLPNIEVTANNVLAFQNQLRTNGLPPDFTQVLTQLGADSATQGEILQRFLGVSLLNANIQQVTALGSEFPDVFAAPSFAAILRDTANTLNQVRFVQMDRQG